MALQKLDNEPACVKCGSYDPNMIYQPETPANPEHLELICACCGFSWKCAPLDAMDPSLDVSAVVKP